MAKHGRAAEESESNVARPGDAARFATRRAGRAAELDRLIHERTRLGILSVLAVNDTLSFNDLKSVLEVTDGNLSVHARKLEEAGYVICAKSFAGRLPHTEFRLTAAGRRALQSYLDHMEAVIRAVKKL